MSTGTPVTSNITYTINSGAPNTIGQAGSGVPGGSVTADDIFFASAVLLEGVNPGDLILLSAGFIITPPVTAAAPANGDYNTFIINTSGRRLSDDGTVAASVPDSLSTLWLGLPIAGMLAFARLRQRRLE